MDRRLILVLIVAVFCSCHGQGRPRYRRDKLYRPGRNTYVSTSCGTDHQVSSSYYTMGLRRSFVFSVKACAYTQLILSSAASRFEFDENGSQITNITLGDDHNSAISILQPDGHKTSVKAPYLLHCKEFRAFWVRWDYEMVEVGRGPLVGEQTLVQARFPENAPPDVHAIGLKCAPGQASIWKVAENSGDHFVTSTAARGDFAHIWKEVAGDGDINVHVKACKDVKILLTEEYGKVSPKHYTIEINGLEGTTKITSATKTEQGQEFPLDCKSYKELWISWTNDRVVLGHGPKVLNQVLVNFLASSTEKAEVRYLSVTNTDPKGAAWIFDDSLEITHLFTTREQQLDKQCKRTESAGLLLSAVDDAQAQYCTFWLELRRESRDFIQFSVAASHTAVIVLTQVKDKSTNNYEIFLRNGTSKIEEGSNVHAPTETPDILDAQEYRDFWISIRPDRLMVGRGHTYDQQTVMNIAWQPQGVKYVGFGHLTGINTWKVPATFGRSLSANTYGGINKSPIWRTTEGRNYVVVRVTVDSDASILLASSPTSLDASAQPFLEITLTPRAENIELHMIYNTYRVKQGATIEVSEDLLGPERQLWVSWPRMGRLAMGVGPLPGRNVLFDTTHDAYTSINAISFESERKQKAEWQLEEEGGDRLLCAMSGPLNLKSANWLDLGSDIWWTTFEVVAVSDVNIFLAYELFDDKKGVEVKLRPDGGKTSTIRELGKDIADRSDKINLDGKESRKFWIRWESQGDVYTVKVGEGNVPSTGATRLEVPNIPSRITALTYWPGQNYETLFLWEETSANWGRFKTDGKSNYEFVVSADHHQDFVFSVKAAKNVEIHLYEVIGAKEDYKYIVRLGVENNMKSQVQPHYDGSIVITRDTPHILSADEFRTFWMTWYAGQLRVGKGAAIGKNAILDFQELRPEVIKVITFTTTEEMDAYWDIPMLTAVTYASSTNELQETSGIGHTAAVAVGIVVGVVILAVLVLAGVLLYRDGKLDKCISACKKN